MQHNVQLVILKWIFVNSVVKRLTGFVWLRIVFNDKLR